MNKEAQNNIFDQFFNMIVSLLREKDWPRKLLLLDILIIIFLNKIAVSTALEIFGCEELIHRIPYPVIWGVLVAAVFVGAVVVALKKPLLRESVLINGLSDRSPIKGLSPFEPEDSEIFAKMQRKETIKECLNTIISGNFRFGIITGESGSGKTSFAQAGLKANFPKTHHACVYVKFTPLDPIKMVRLALIRDFKIPGEQEKELEQADLIGLFEYAAKTENRPIVFIFDQFEQFFICRRTKEEREPFIQAMAAWFKNYPTLPVKILVSIRGDFNSHMIEFQKAMAYTIGPQQHFRLEKFTPKQATEIFRLIARVEDMKFDERFVKELTKELAGNDGLISPVDMQVLAWMIKGQNSSEEKAFNRKTYEKLGGIEGLLEIFLKRSLDALLSKEKRENALNVLLALIDPEREMCFTALTLDDLHQKLGKIAGKKEIEETVNWLARPDVRLISPNKVENNITFYQVSHEKLIPAVRKITGKELTEASRANQVLAQRTNEWRGNNQKSKYLLSWKEIRLIKKHDANLTWGKLEKQKKSLIAKSRRRLKVKISILAISLLVLGLLGGWWISPQGRIQQIHWKLDDLVSKKVDNEEVLRNIAAAFAKNDNLEKSFWIIDKMDNDSYKASSLLEILRILTKRGKIDTAIAVTEKLGDPSHKARAFLEIAAALAWKKQTGDANKFVEKVISIVKSKEIKNPSEKINVILEAAKALIQLNHIKDAISLEERLESSYHRTIFFLEMAKACKRKKNSREANELLQKALSENTKLEDFSLKAQILIEISRFFFENKEAQKAYRLLDQAIAESERIWNPPDKYDNLMAIAKIFTQNGNLKKATVTANKIDDYGDKANVFFEIAEILSKKRKNDEFLKIWSTAVENADKISHEPVSAPIMIKAVKVLAKNGEINDLVSFAEERKTPYIRALVFAEIAKMLANTGTSSEFKRILKRAISESENIKRYYYNFNTANVSEISNKRDQVLVAIVDSYLEAQKWASAFVITDRITDSNKMGDTLANILSAWASRKYPELNNEKESKS
jgi:tetratricopeptide (TPR) repeat protein